MGSCLGYWVAFADLTVDLKACVYDRNLLFQSLGLLMFFLLSLEMWWHLVTADEYCMLNCVGLREQLFSLKYTIPWITGLVMLVFATESGVVWAESWEATGLLENVFCSGLVSSLFFTCKIMFLEWIKMGARDLLRVNPEICVLWAASLESSKRELIAIVCFTIVCLDKGFILKSQKKPNF